VTRGLTRRALLAGAAGLALGPAASRRLRAAATAPPSFVFVLSDNHRADALGAAGHPWVETPALDRLAAEGLRFENAFCTTPLCSPARAGFLTGLHAHRHGVWNNAERSRWDETHTTFLERLKAGAGHATAFIGKWHMPASGLPRLRGVDHFVTFTVQHGQGRYRNCPLVVDGRPEASRRAYVTEELTDRALAFVEAHRRQPFALVLSHKAVHHPWRPAPRDEGRYAHAPVTLPPEASTWAGLTDGNLFGGVTQPLADAYRTYMETLTSLDRDVGRLLDALDALGLAGRTVVVYASDNGFLFGEHRRTELRWPLEEVLRIPLLIRAPAHVRDPGGRRAQMALNLDLGPTLLELAGLAPPPDLDGRSLVPCLRDPQAPGRDAWLLEHAREFPYPVPGYRGVRTRRHLYVEYEGRFAPTLHDLARDPRQTRNLIGTPEGDRLRPELARRLARLRAEAGDA
jgi:N-acetylglucosamine-6-sulfatase